MGARLTDEQLGTCEFAAPTPWGPLHLSLPLCLELPNQIPLPDALGHAMSLSHGEALVVELEAWCGQALAWQPVPAGLGRDGSHVSASVCDARLAPVGGGLRVPLALLRQQPLPASLQAPFLSWPQWSFDATLAELPDELLRATAIDVGDMLLLPEAFHGDWTVSLEAIGSDGGHLPAADGLSGVLDLDEACIDVVKAVQALRPTVRQDWRVRLSQPVHLDMATALGWQEAEIALPLDGERGGGGQIDFGVHAQLHHRERGLVLSGMVVPVLLGAALWVRTRHQVV